MKLYEEEYECSVFHGVVVRWDRKARELSVRVEDAEGNRSTRKFEFSPWEVSHTEVAYAEPGNIVCVVVELRDNYVNAFSIKDHRSFKERKADKLLDELGRE